MSHQRHIEDQRRFKKICIKSGTWSAYFEEDDNGNVVYYYRTWKTRNSIRYLKKVANRKVRYAAEVGQHRKYIKIDCAKGNYY